LIVRVDGSKFCGMGQAEDPRVGIVDVTAADDGLFDGFKIEFAAGTGDVQNFGAVGEKLRCAALVGFHMSQLMADNAVIGTTESRQGK